jgi:hypothetical protein
MKKTIPFMALMLAVALAMPAFGQVAAIDYYGFAWETGGFPPSEIGDNLTFTCVGDAADALFGVDLGTEELTFYMSALSSLGEVDLGGGNLQIDYTGGTLKIYRDAAMNAEWGVGPLPNATSPSTFIDGTLFFEGTFNNMRVYLTPLGYGAFEGTLDGVGGTMINEICSDCVYTWGGNFTPPSGAQIPDGYDLQVDGVFEIDRAVSTEESSWGSVKALFN